jgi:hypothetical protein
VDKEAKMELTTDKPQCKFQGKEKESPQFSVCKPPEGRTSKKMTRELRE